MWAYIVSVLRRILDGKAATLVTNLVSCLAHTIKPDVAGRLFNRPTECWQLYTLAVCTDLSLTAGLSAESVFALQRAYSGFGNTKASTSGHARSSVMGTLADALGDSDAMGDDEEENDVAAGDELRETGTVAPFRAVPKAAAQAAAAGGASASAASASGAPFVPATVPEDVPSNLWELLSCVKEPRRRAFTDKRRAKAVVYDAFVAVVQRVWDSADGRAVLRVLEDKTLLSITPAFAMRVSVLLSLRVCMQCSALAAAAPAAGGASAAAGGATSSAPQCPGHASA